MTETPAIIPRRRITGMSAILLPHLDPQTPDWPALEAHIARTHEAGLTPAVNMDTGYVQLIDDATRVRIRGPRHWAFNESDITHAHVGWGGGSFQRTLSRSKLHGRR